MSETNIATMTAAQLEEHVERLEERQKNLLKSLKALARARKAEEEANGGGDE